MADHEDEVPLYEQVNAPAAEVGDDAPPPADTTGIAPADGAANENENGPIVDSKSGADAAEAAATAAAVAARLMAEHGQKAYPVSSGAQHAQVRYVPLPESVQLALASALHGQLETEHTTPKPEAPSPLLTLGSSVSLQSYDLQEGNNNKRPREDDEDGDGYEGAGKKHAPNGMVSEAFTGTEPAAGDPAGEYQTMNPPSGEPATEVRGCSPV